MPHHAENRSVVEQACVEFERDLKAFLRGMLTDPNVVNDVFQRTVVKAIEAAESVNPKKVRGWLFQIALNEARELKRTSSRQGRHHRAVWEAFSQLENADYQDGLSGVLLDEEKEHVRRALSRLSNEYREVVIRRIQKGQTFAVIAEEMEKPLGTVLTWMRRALNELREMQEVRQLAED